MTGKDLEVSKDTRTTVGAAFAFALLVFSAYSYLEHRFNTLDRRLERMEFTEKLISTDRWRRSDQKLFLSELKNLNPNLNLPKIGE